MALKPIQILINAKDNASSVFSSVQAKVTALAAAVAAFVGIKIFGTAVDSAEALDVQMRKLQSIITATGGAAGLTADEIDEMARRLDEATLGSAAGFRDAAGQLLTFKSIGKDAFETTLLLAQDLADSGFGNLSTNAKQLGKALEDPVKGMGQLAESGVTFTAEQQKVIKILVETGQAAKAQQVILEAVAGQVGGTAKAIGGGLSGALDLVNKRFTDLKEQLGKAVLPVLADFNNSLAKIYKNLTDSGVVQRFGEAIASGMQTALRATEEFISRIDFEALIERFRSFADEVGKSFSTIQEYATNAGNGVSLAYNVMATGVNTVKAAIFGIGSVFAEVAGTVMAGVATLREGLASVTFGSLSQGFKEAAADARVSAEGFRGAAQALRDEAAEALSDTTESALKARAAWGALTETVDDSTESAGKASSAFGALAKSLEATAEANRKAAEAQASQVKSAEASRAAVEKLKAEYAALISDGNLQAAVLKLEEINASLRDTPGAAAGAEAAALKVAVAFKDMGVQTKQELKAIADKAKSDFQLIEKSGQATAAGLQTAFAKYAEAVIAANGGVATDALKAEASLKGMEIAADSAGKTIVRAMTQGREATRSMKGEVENTTEAIKEQIGFLDRLKERNDAVKSSIKTDGQGFAADESGNRIVAGGDLTTRTGILNFLKSAGVDDEQAARRITNEFSNSKGEIDYFNNAGQIKYGGKNGTISQALLKAAESYTFGAGAGAMGGASSAPQSSQSVNVNISIGGQAPRTVKTDQAGSGVIQDLLRELEQARRAS